MSKATTRQRVTQLTEWMKTLKPQRKKPVKSSIHAASKSNDKPSYIK